MIPIDTFRTRRLTAERVRAHDFRELCRMHQDVRAMATLGGVRPDDETYRSLLSSLDHWDQHGFGLWMFHDQADGRFVGRGGLRQVEVDGNREVELAYAVRVEFWGKGLATEMAEGALNVGFERLGMPNVVALTLPTNGASLRVMEKSRFTYERAVIWADLPHVLYRITRAEWSGRQRR